MSFYVGGSRCAQLGGHCSYVCASMAGRPDQSHQPNAPGQSGAGDSQGEHVWRTGLPGPTGPPGRPGPAGKPGSPGQSATAVETLELFTEIAPRGSWPEAVQTRPSLENQAAAPQAPLPDDPAVEARADPGMGLKLPGAPLFECTSPGHFENDSTLCQ